MSLLTLVQRACVRIGIPKPISVSGSTDTQVIQLMELANEEGQTQSEQYEWQALRQEATFTTVAANLQGPLSTIAPGLKYITNQTIWDRTLNRPVFGPIDPQRWQQLMAQRFTGPWWQFRIFNNQIYFVQIPNAGDLCYFEYTTKNWATVAAGGTDSQFTADADTALFDEDIMLMGLIWRWKAAKGLDFSVDFDKYNSRLMNAMAADGSKDIINMGDARFDIEPAILVPSGSWNV